MKTRLGFVSNSSSSSFVLPKKDMTEEQIEKIEKYAELLEGKDCTGDTSINSTKSYFFGRISYTNMDLFKDYLKDIKVDIKELEAENE